MRDYIDVTGKTEEEAIQKGLDQLGLDRYEVSVEILERAKNGFLGFGSAPAKVRLSYGEERPDPVPVTPVPDTAAEPVKPARPAERKKRPEKTAEASPEAPAASAAPADRPEKSRRRPRRQDAPKQDAPRQNVQKQDAPKPPRQAPSKPEEAKPAESTAPAPLPQEEVQDAKAAAIKAFLSGLLEHMGQENAVIRVYLPEEGRYKVILEGQNMGALIGRRGETLDAIQQLTSYSVNRTGNRVRIHLDAEGYREKRERSLCAMARKEAAKVVKLRRSRTLEPMNAYERHVIHTALQDFRGVNTYSTGTDPNRRVVVAYDREKL